MKIVLIYCAISAIIEFLIIIQVYFIVKHEPEYQTINWKALDSSFLETAFNLFKFYLMCLVPLVRWFLLYAFLFDNDSIIESVREKLRETYREQQLKIYENE